MGANNWTPDQWRAYNARTGDRHVVRRLPPLSRYQALEEDIAQERALARLERRPRRVDEYLRRERAWISRTESLDAA